MNVLATTDQHTALERLLSWYKNPDKQYITLGGFAGTGKTTLLAVLRHQLHKKYPKLKVAFCAFTGKATQVLYQNILEQNALFKQDKVSTIHSLIYEVRTESDKKDVRWEKRYYLEYDLIIIDEASMISSQLWEDLLSFGVPIIAAGDHGQLPPIGENFSLMQSPDIRLEQIHRQAATSPIITISQVIRETGFIPVKKFGNGVIKYSRQDPDIGSIMQTQLESWNEDTLFLVGMNWTRTKLNQQIRSQRELYSPTPVVGDRLICLKNNWQIGIYNGIMGTVLKIENETDKQGKHQWYLVDVALDDGRVYRGKISKHQFESPTTLSEVTGLTYTEIGDLFDFGYALTVHKAQGSQAKKVVVFEERNKHMDDQQWRRWLYTAVTRAEQELVIIGD